MVKDWQTDSVMLILKPRDSTMHSPKHSVTHLHLVREMRWGLMRRMVKAMQMGLNLLTLMHFPKRLVIQRRKVTKKRFLPQKDLPMLTDSKKPMVKGKQKQKPMVKDWHWDSNWHSLMHSD